jgi:alpha-tubulin suppressor-like RCC1 family protein
VSLVSVEAIGGGGGGGDTFISSSYSAGGGGAYAKTTSITGLTAGGTVYYKVGAGTKITDSYGVNGTDSWFNTSNTAPSSSTTGVLAKAGLGGMAGGTGGQAGSSVGSTVYSGGNGGGSAGSQYESGGGGAAGPSGAGKNGGNGYSSGNESGGGGGGSNGGSSTAGSNQDYAVSGDGGNGGAGTGGTGGGTRGLYATDTRATDGTNGGGGGGSAGSATSYSYGGKGGSSVIWTATAGGTTAGSGGGGGGGGDYPGDGGLYGGGGGSGYSLYSGPAGYNALGAQGIVVFTYLGSPAPVPTQTSGFSSIGENLKNKFLTSTDLIDNFVGGQLWNWGSQMIGDGATICRSSPVQTIAQGTNWAQVQPGVVAFAIKTDGTLWIWGFNAAGFLGDGSTINRSSPVQTIGSSNSWKSLPIQSAGVPSAIKTDGTLWTWGAGTCGALGNNSTINRSSPVQTIAGGNNWKQFGTGGYNTAAIKTDGTLWVWGPNTVGQLGNSSTLTVSSPVQVVGGGTTWKQAAVSSCISGIFNTSMAVIKTDGTLWTWGYGRCGVLGNGLTVNQSSPVQTIAGGSTWKCIVIGCNHMTAMKTDGSIWAWGFGDAGQLGDNTVISRSSPVQTITGGNNWKQISNFYGGTSATKTDGTLWVWGCNACGQLGTGFTLNRSSPVQTIAQGTNWKLAGSGFNNVAAITFC